MTEEKLQILNDLSSKIKNRERIFKTVDNLRPYKLVITDFNNGQLEIPSELQNVFFTLLEDYHTKILEALEIEFAEM